MKKTYKVALVASVGMLGVGLAGNAFAFHDGGVAHCDGCHTMHNSNNGAINANGGTVGTGITSTLTKGSDASSTCLNCHQGTAGGYHVKTTTGPVDATHTNAGGDFYWLTTDVRISTRSTSLAADHGHNVVAADFGLVEDTVLTVAPSDGTVAYSASNLGCNSCHDPHGKKDNNINPLPIGASGSYGNPITAPGQEIMGNFRLLGGVGYDGGLGGGLSFSAGDPVAVGKNGIDHTDYGSGMSEWCANCHSGFTAADTIATHRHPAGDNADLGAVIAANYNAYITTGDMGGDALTSFDNMVAFERGIFDAENDGVPDGALSVTTTAGPDAASNVMCLTCHRAHATSSPNMGRWNLGMTLLVEEEALAISDGFTSVQLNNGVDISTKYGEYQRSLCNKCHVQD
ncbi:MAG: cytochrome C [Proteobacteria bacterium]|nr:cytochrome C [Pseudomonadota bacterium]MBU1641015.1 cytochrome C [Pseudomonadota bacterium]